MIRNILFFFSLFFVSAVYGFTIIKEGNEENKYGSYVNFSSTYYSNANNPIVQTEQALLNIRLFTPLYQLHNQIVFSNFGVGYHSNQDMNAQYGMGYRYLFNNLPLLLGTYAYYSARTLSVGVMAQGTVGAEMWWNRFFLGGHYNTNLWDSFTQKVSQNNYSEPYITKQNEIYTHDVLVKRYLVERQLIGGSVYVGANLGYGMQLFVGGYSKHLVNYYALPTEYAGIKVKFFLNVRKFLSLQIPLRTQLRFGYGYDKPRKDYFTVGINFGYDITPTSVFKSFSAHMVERPLIEETIDTIDTNSSQDFYSNDTPFIVDGHTARIAYVHSVDDLYNSQADFYQILSKELTFDHPYTLQLNKTICGTACKIEINGKTYTLNEGDIELPEDVTFNFSTDGILLSGNNRVNGIIINVPKKSLYYSIYYHNANGQLGDVMISNVNTNGHMSFLAKSAKLNLSSIQFTTGDAPDKTVQAEMGSYATHYGAMEVGDITIVSNATKSTDFTLEMQSIQFNYDEDEDNKAHSFSGIIIDGVQPVTINNYFGFNSIHVNSSHNTSVCGACLNVNVTDKDLKGNKMYVSIYTINVSGNKAYGLWVNGTFKHVYNSRITVHGNDINNTVAVVNEGNISDISFHNLESNGIGFWNKSTGVAQGVSASTITGFKEKTKAMTGILNDGTIKVNDSEKNQYGFKLNGNIEATGTGIVNNGTLTSTSTQKAIEITGTVTANQKIDDHGNTTSSNIKIGQ